MRQALVHGRIFGATGIVSGQALLLEGGRITAIVGDDDPRLADAVIHDLDGQLLLPGFVDTQVNGGGGVLFNDSPTVEGIRRIGAAHRRYGTTSFLPTLISDDLDVVAQGIAAVQAAITAGVEGVIGIHIVGPFISKARTGVHDAARFRSIDASVVKLLSSLKRGTTLVTLAPELTSPTVLAELARAGVILAAGHSDASYAESATAR